VGADRGTLPSRVVALVVEDNEHLRNAEAQALGSCGYDVRACASAEEAVQIFAGSDVDLLVTDIWLAGPLSGIALARAVKQSRPDVKVMIVSSDGDLLSSEDCRGIADSVLKKPFRLGELQERAVALVRPQPRVGAPTRPDTKLLIF
jgi:DNA-binding response OmpR family regulator